MPSHSSKKRSAPSSKLAVGKNKPIGKKEKPTALPALLVAEGKQDDS